MAFNINAFQAALKFGGAKSSLFQVTLTNPINGAGDILIPFMVRSAAIPPSILATQEVPYFGRRVKQPGNRQFEPWNVTAYNDEDFVVRNALEEWSNSMNTMGGNLRNLSSSSHLLYSSTAQVTQFSKTGIPLRTYNFVGIFPSIVGQIDLDWEAEGVQQFPVTFEYQYWEVTGGITGNGGGS